MMKIYCAESGYWIEIDGIMSDAHRYGYACVGKGPSGQLYAAVLDDEPEEGKKAQLYRLVPVDSITESNLEDSDTEYQELPDDEDEDVEEEEEGEAEEAEEEGGEAEEEEDDGVEELRP